MIVVDVGCMTHGTEESEGPLIRGFEPDLYLGFDAHPEMRDSVEYARAGATLVVRRRLVAWVYDGFVPLYVDGTTTGVLSRENRLAGPARVPCFDLATFLRALPQPLVLKLDVEGGEYPLLERIVDLGIDEHLDAVLVEWHSPDYSHGFYADRPELACEVKEWP